MDEAWTGLLKMEEVTVSFMTLIKRARAQLIQYRLVKIGLWAAFNFFFLSLINVC
jgi:hypothetical protein